MYQFYQKKKKKIRNLDLLLWLDFLLPNSKLISTFSFCYKQMDI